MTKLKYQYHAYHDYDAIEDTFILQTFFNKTTIKKGFHKKNHSNQDIAIIITESSTVINLWIKI